MTKEEQLRKLYMESGKHSHYQILPDCLKRLLPEQELNIRSRQEQERFDYIRGHLDFSGKRVLDIGGNTGFFSFEAVSAGAAHVDYYEGNKAHAEFVQISSDILNLKNKISVFPDYYLFRSVERKYDIVLCLNVLHHLGDDFGRECCMEKAKEKILRYINRLSGITQYLVLQLGFNWCGDTKKCLFRNGTKKEMEEYITDGTGDSWNMLCTGIAEEHGTKIQYSEKNADNNERNDALGEFLNRPVFIMESKKEYTTESTPKI